MERRKNNMRGASPGGRNTDRNKNTGGRRADSGKNSDKRKKQEKPYSGRAVREEQPAFEMPEHLMIGRNPVMEALKSGRGIDRLLVVKGAGGSIIKIEGMARDRNLMIQYVQRSVLDRMTDGAAHQGVAAFVSEVEYCEPEDILRKAEEKGEDPFIIILDGIEDPHNVGAIIRTADAAGAHGVILQKRRAASITPTAEKAAAGAVEYVPAARVTNLVRTIQDLKEQGVWIGAADMAGSTVWDSDLTGPVAIVIGNEGHGISRLVREQCDFTVSFPMLGKINSLNASNAAALLMYEVVRQRREKKK